VTSSLNIGLIGNGQVAALVDERARIVWGCFPGFAGDPLFSRLIDETDRGYYAVELEDCVSSTQCYLHNTAILQTRLQDAHGGQVSVIDFAPGFEQYDRNYRPIALVRQVSVEAGSPRVRIRLRPVCNWGSEQPRMTRGSHHIRYLTDEQSLRLTTDIPVSRILEERAFGLVGTQTLIFGPDESLTESPATLARSFLERTRDSWRQWVRSLSIPYDWQQAVIRAAITLKLSSYAETGAVVAALTTSIPEAAGTERNWDYRHCWLRDAYFVVRALNRLGATRSMEDYIRFILDCVADSDDGQLQPVYGVTGESRLDEWHVTHLTGYRNTAPVRVGNDAYRQIQHDVYGSVILAATQIFFDRRLPRPGDVSLFRQLEPLGEKAYANYLTPDAGIWEYRGRTRVHTHSALLCWVACDRLARIAAELQLEADAERWRDAAREIHDVICRRGWNEEQNSFVESFEGRDIDASLLLMNELGFLPPDDPRFLGTVEAVGRVLRRGDYLFRYAAQDDFGEPENAFNICTFWYIEALAATGQRAEANRLFENMLANRNALGLLSEDIDPDTGELWGNFPQTYSMVGIINAALRLSRSWEEML